MKSTCFKLFFGKLVSHTMYIAGNSHTTTLIWTINSREGKCALKSHPPVLKTQFAEVRFLKHLWRTLNSHQNFLSNRHICCTSSAVHFHLISIRTESFIFELLLKFSASFLLSSNHLFPSLSSFSQGNYIGHNMKKTLPKPNGSLLIEAKQNKACLLFLINKPSK